MSMNLLDQPEILRVLFYPRRDLLVLPPPGVRLVAVEVEPGVMVGGRLYPAVPG
jgi:hypothetical protein